MSFTSWNCFVCGRLFSAQPLHWACLECRGSRFELPKLMIGICGRARNGKDFVGNIVQGALASQLKDSVFCSSVSTVVFDEGRRLGLIKAERREDCDKDDLDALVKLGHRMRAKDEDHWLRGLSVRIANSHCRVAIVPGIRFPNEIHWLRQANGVVLKITCLNPDGSPYISLDRDPNDPMETVLNRIVPDYEITAMRGQVDWLHWQGIAFTNFIIRKYLSSEATL
jgi:hypothetical protein